MPHSGSVPFFLSPQFWQYCWILPLPLFLTQLPCCSFITQGDSSTFSTSFRHWRLTCVGVIFCSYGWLLRTQSALEEEIQTSHFVLQAWLPLGIQHGENCLENNTEWLEMCITGSVLWECAQWGESWGRNTSTKALFFTLDWHIKFPFHGASFWLAVLLSGFANGEGCKV